MSYNIEFELTQKTVQLTWNEPQRVLPEAQNEQEASVQEVSVVLAHRGNSEFGVYDLMERGFFDQLGYKVSQVDFWAYMPKHPNK